MAPPGLINKVLDLIEGRGGSFHISECIVRPNKGQVKNTSTVVVEVEAQTQEVVAEIVRRVQSLVDLIEVQEEDRVQGAGVESADGESCARDFRDTAIPRTVVTRA